MKVPSYSVSRHTAIAPSHCCTAAPPHRRTTLLPHHPTTLLTPSPHHPITARPFQFACANNFAGDPTCGNPTNGAGATTNVNWIWTAQSTTGPMKAKMMYHYFTSKCGPLSAVVQLSTCTNNTVYRHHLSLRTLTTRAAFPWQNYPAVLEMIKIMFTSNKWEVSASGGHCRARESSHDAITITIM